MKVALLVFVHVSEHHTDQWVPITNVNQVCYLPRGVNPSKMTEVWVRRHSHHLGTEGLELVHTVTEGNDLSGTDKCAENIQRYAMNINILDRVNCTFEDYLSCLYQCCSSTYSWVCCFQGTRAPKSKDFNLTRQGEPNFWLIPWFLYQRPSINHGTFGKLLTTFLTRDRERPTIPMEDKSSSTNTVVQIGTEASATVRRNHGLTNSEPRCWCFINAQNMFQQYSHHTMTQVSL